MNKIWANHRVKFGGMAVFLTIAMLMMGICEATTTDNIITIDNATGNVVYNDYAIFNISIANNNTIVNATLYAGENATNLTTLKTWSINNTTFNTLYNYTNLTFGKTYYWKLIYYTQLNNTTAMHIVNGSFMVKHNVMIYFTGDDAYKTYITIGAMLFGEIMQTSKKYKAIGKLLIIGGIIAGAYWFVLPYLGVI